MPSSATDHLHFIEHRHENGRGIVARFICKGDPNSPCHQYPADAERWTEDDKPAFISHDECWVAPWMYHQECAELCCPEDEPVRDGAIRTWFEDCVMWEYINDTKLEN